MANSEELEKIWGKGAGDRESSLEVPSPPPEVKIRTFRSDLESSAASGGGLPQFEKIAVPVPEGKESGEGGSKFVLVVVAALAAATLTAVAYLSYRIFSDKAASEAGSAPGSIQPPSAATGAGSAPSAYIRKSLLGKPADGVVEFVVSGSAARAEELQTYSQRLSSFLVQASDGEFLEVAHKGPGNRDLSLTEVFSLADTAVLDMEFVSEHFAGDFTFFIYNDKGGIWPGYVLALKPGENWLFLKTGASLLEQSPKIENFFLKAPGARSPEGFKDGIVGGEPVRILRFSSVSSTFAYAWSRGKLILSASEKGLEMALSRL